MSTYIPRYPRIENLLQKGKVLAIYGPRQCGKTSLVKEFLKTTNLKYIFLSGDFLETKISLGGEPKKVEIEKYGSYDLVVVDEAQLVPNIGRNLKALVDMFPEIQVIITGSSSFELAGQVGEPLVGRQVVLDMFPFWEKELEGKNLVRPDNFWYENLVFGKYPEVVLKEGLENKKTALRNIINGYLFKDILAFERIQKPEVLLKLLELLAYQIGSEASIPELARQLQIDQKTVNKYIELLKQVFIIFELSAFSKNPRKEVVTKKKYYFRDLGIRNAVLGNFNVLDSRPDVGVLWENYCLIERVKKNSYSNSWAKSYFWRTKTQVEIDYIEDSNGGIQAFEFKWSSGKVVYNAPNTFMEPYPDSKFETVNQGNYRDFII